jgi:hypothetical protein
MVKVDKSVRAPNPISDLFTRDELTLAADEESQNFEGLWRQMEKHS